MVSSKFYIELGLMISRRPSLTVYVLNVPFSRRALMNAYMDSDIQAILKSKGFRAIDPTHSSRQISYHESSRRKLDSLRAALYMLTGLETEEHKVRVRLRSYSSTTDYPFYLHNGSLADTEDKMVVVYAEDGSLRPMYRPMGSDQWRLLSSEKRASRDGSTYDDVALSEWVTPRVLVQLPKGSQKVLGKGEQLAQLPFYNHNFVQFPHD